MESSRVDGVEKAIFIKYDAIAKKSGVLMMRGLSLMAGLIVGVLSLMNSSTLWGSSIGTDLARDRVAELERKVELLSRRIEILEHDLDQSVRVRCNYRWVDGAQLGLQGDARFWLFPVVDGCPHSDIRL
jgi:hypothetical protein